MDNDSKISKALRLSNLRLPPSPRVTKIEWKHHEEESSASYEEPEMALWLTVLLDENTKGSERHWVQLEPIDEAIRAALRDAGIELFPYIDFLKPSERTADVED